jgi:hypothetical protein
VLSDSVHIVILNKGIQHDSFYSYLFLGFFVHFDVVCF